MSNTFTDPVVTLVQEELPLITESLLFLRLKRASKIIYGLKESLKTNAVDAIYLSELYYSSKFKNKKLDLKGKKLYLITKPLLSKLKSELKKNLDFNVISFLN